MSSSSSSECLCPDCIQFGTRFRTVRARNPFRQDLGQPLVYYAQMKQSPLICDKRCRETRKCEPSCFSKAFRWYTQERRFRKSASRSRPPAREASRSRPPARDPAREDPGLSEFAMWLDKKYVEFLQENENCDCSQAKPNTAPPCFEDDKKITSAPAPAPPAPPCDTCQTKFFTRVRSFSPWRKKHRNKEQTSTVEKRLQSLEFILEPQELSRPTSEFNQQTPPTKRSGVSVVSSESQISKKTVIKTRNLEKNLSDKKLKSFEINRNEGPNISRHQEPLKSPPPQGSKQYCIARDVSCQYPETKLVTIDTQTQYYESDWSRKDGSSTTYHTAGNSPNLPSGPTQQVCDCDKTALQPKPSKYVTKDIEKKRSNIACQCSLYEIPKNDTAYASKDTKIYRNVECHCVLVPTAYEWNDASKDKEVPKEASVITRCVNYPCEQITIQKSLKTSENQTSTGKNRNISCSFKNARNDTGLQTSDNPIDLERDGVRKYPLFMKIVYADKLKEERPRI